MTRRPERIRHARQPGLDDYYGLTVRDYSLCGELAGARDSLPYTDFRKLVEFQNADQLDPDLIPL